MEEATYIGQLVNVSGDKSKMQGKVYLLTFDWFGKTVGTVEMKGKKLHFEGDADKSAKLLFDKLIVFVEQYIQERLQPPKGAEKGQNMK